MFIFCIWGIVYLCLHAMYMYYQKNPEEGIRSLWKWNRMAEGAGFLESRSSRRTARGLNCWIISPVLYRQLFTIDYVIFVWTQGNEWLAFWYFKTKERDKDSEICISEFEASLVLSSWCSHWGAEALLLWVVSRGEAFWWSFPLVLEEIQNHITASDRNVSQCWLNNWLESTPPSEPLTAEVGIR